ncbi:MAG: hypothetical protein ACRDYD_12175 [Acidimicrobiales bacterium]
MSRTGAGGRRPATDRRRRLEVALGALWLLDGALQLQPAMLDPGFFRSLLDMADMGLPRPLSLVSATVAAALAAHPAVWDSCFGALQICIGLGLMWARSARTARAASILWALCVWTIGEGMGGLFMAGTTALGGAPGAALLYALAAVVLWPAEEPPGRRRSEPSRSGEAAGGGAPLGSSRHGGGLGGRAAVILAGLWAGTALLELEPANHAPAVPGALLAIVGQGEPLWLARINASVGQHLANAGLELAIALGTAQVLVAALILRPTSRRAGLALGIALSLVYWAVGQDLGGLLTGEATDPDTGPLLALLALAAWPLPPAPPAEVRSGSPARERAPAPWPRALPPRQEPQVRPASLHQGSLLPEPSTPSRCI